LDADADAVAEVLINLISNAMKYSTQKRYLKIAVRRTKEGIACTVEDHGCGIPDETIPHIFEKFFRAPGASRKAHGVGLGLSVVKHIMDAHHGQIAVRSRPGYGSKFSLLFPIHQPAESVRSTP